MQKKKQKQNLIYPLEFFMSTKRMFFYIVNAIDILALSVKNVRFNHIDL